jgi:hypothetical protein
VDIHHQFARGRCEGELSGSSTSWRLRNNARLTDAHPIITLSRATGVVDCGLLSDPVIDFLRSLQMRDQVAYANEIWSQDFSYDFHGHGSHTGPRVDWALTIRNEGSLFTPKRTGLSAKPRPGRSWRQSVRTVIHLKRQYEITPFRSESGRASSVRRFAPMPIGSCASAIAAPMS